MPLSMERWNGRVAIVTGASSGIGAATASALVDHGMKVVALGRRKDRLEALAQSLQNSPGTLYPFETDMTKEADIIKAFEYAKTLGPIHVLINSAGLAKAQATLTQGDTQSWREILDVNVLGLSIATREAVRDMRAQNVDGHIVHLNSLSGHRVPGLSPSMYSPSKFAVTALTETLRQELNSLGSKIKITSVSPGYVETEFADVSGLRNNPVAAKFLDSMHGLQAEDVSDVIVYVLSTPPHVQVHEVMLRPIEQKL